MKILHVYRDFAAPGGIPQQTRELVQAQARLGHEILVFCLNTKESPDLVGHFQFTNLRIIYINLHGLNEHQLRSWTLEFNPDIVHISVALIPLHSFWYCLLLPYRRRTIISTHGLFSPAGMKTRFGIKKKSYISTYLKNVFATVIDEPYLKRTGGIHAQSNYEAELMNAKGAHVEMIIPMGVNDNWFDKQNLQSNFSGPLTFTYLGRLDVYHKGLDLILEAAALLQGEGLNFKIKLVGSDLDGNTQDLISLVNTLRLQNVVSIEKPTWGDENAKRLLFEQTHFFLGIFRYAGMARACGEAVARGIPLIASREGNWGDWVEAYNFGFCADLTTQGVVKSLRQAIYTPPKIYRDYSEQAYSFATEHTWRKVAEQFIYAYSRFALDRNTNEEMGKSNV